MYSDLSKIREIIAFFKKKNISYLQEGALFIRTTSFGDDKDRVILKSDGDYTYFFSDIIYHLYKLNNYDKVINI